MISPKGICGGCTGLLTGVLVLLLLEVTVLRDLEGLGVWRFLLLLSSLRGVRGGVEFLLGVGGGDNWCLLLTLFVLSWSLNELILRGNGANVTGDNKFLNKLVTLIGVDVWLLIVWLVLIVHYYYYYLMYLFFLYLVIQYVNYYHYLVAYYYFLYKLIF